MKKRFLCFILCLVLLSGVLVIPAYAKSSRTEDGRLRFHKDGKFTIMQISDIQDDVLLEPATKELLRAELKANPCDLILLTGDNISSSSTGAVGAYLAIRQFMSEFERAGIPVAMTFGNHDDENTPATKELQLKLYQQFDCFIGKAGENLGSGNLCTYFLPIYSSRNPDEVKNLIWMIDSGTYNSENSLGGYAAVTRAQVDWYKRTSEAFEREYGRKIPGLMFQHIVVPEIWEALTAADPSTPGGVWHNGKYYVLPAGSKGKMDETPCPPQYSNGEFDAVVQRGDILAMFFGHDHVNTYEIKSFRGVDLCSTPGVGFNSYNNENVGVRLITLNENSPWSYETKVVSYFDLFDYDDDSARYLFKSASSLTDSKTHFAAGVKYVFSRIGDLLSFPPRISLFR